MSTEIKKEIQLEIAYVLFIDIVGYSKLLINEQIRRSPSDFEPLSKLCRVNQANTADTSAVFAIDACSQFCWHSPTILATLR